MSDVKLTGIILSCVLLAACGGTDRVVSVTGHGELTVVPDRADVLLAVESRGMEVPAVRDQASTVVQKVISLCDSLDIPKDAVQTSALRIQPVYDWKDGRQTFQGYTVQRDITVRLQDLSKLGALMERAVSTGVNQVSPPRLYSSKSDEAYRQALALAAADAHANAEAATTRLGATVGKVLQISMQDGSAPQPRGVVMQAKAADDSYQPGSQTVRADVQVVFAVEGG